MSFPWPVINGEAVLDEALNIALRYFDLPSGEAEYADIESRAGQTIMEDWRRGVRDEAILANKAIAELEEHHPLGNKLRRAG
jgi:hypothetical protein